MKQSPALRQAIEAAGGARALARDLGITHPSIHQWADVPLKWVIEIERVTGIHRSRLRPDYWPPEPKRRKRAA